MVRDPRDSKSTRNGTSADRTGTDTAVVITPGKEVLEVLSDEYTHTLLEALSDSPQPARSLVEDCDMSRPTVYRRLNRLQEYGLVRTTTEINPDGHHRKLFEATLDRLTVGIGADGPTVRLTIENPDRSDTPVPASAD